MQLVCVTVRQRMKAALNPEDVHQNFGEAGSDLTLVFLCVKFLLTGVCNSAYYQP